MLFSKKQGNKFCLFGGCAGRKTRPSNNDYECLPYEPTEPNKRQIHKREQPKCEPTPVKVQSTQNRASLTHLNKLLKQTTRANETPFAPAIESTRVEQSLVRYPAINQKHAYITAKTTSTFVQRTHYRDNNESNEPSLSHISEQSSCLSNPQAKSAASFQPLYPSPSINPESAVHVCVRPYESRHPGDISLRYSERVHVLHVTDGYVFVKLVAGWQECGYVAASSLLLMSEFMKRI